MMTNHLKWVQEKFNIVVSRSSVSKILNSNSNYDMVMNKSCKRIKTVTYPEFEKELKNFVEKFQHRTCLSNDI